VLRANGYTNLSARYATFSEQAAQFAGLPQPRRDYNAMTLTAHKRFGRTVAARASYTYARTIGNYPGLFDPYIGQRDPNLSELFDVQQNMFNRVGPLPADIPHQLKLDGYYALPLRANQRLVFGGSLRAQSGTPRAIRAFSVTEGGANTFVLPTTERNDPT